MSDEPPPPPEAGPPPGPGDWSFPTVDLPPAYESSPAASDPSFGSSVEEPAGPDAADAEEPPSEGVAPVPRRVPSTTPPVSPIRALAGAAVAVAGVLLGIGALLWATDAPKGSPTVQTSQAQSSQPTSSAPTQSPSSAPAAAVRTPAPRPTTTTVAAPAPTAPKLPLTVLNNSTRQNLAARAAARYSAAGWPIKLVGSFRGRISVTTVYYAPGQQGSAVLLQKSFPAIARVRPRFTGLPGAGLTVVLTRDYPG